MSETLFLPPSGSREEIYQALLPQVAALISSEQDLVANLANIAAALREAFGFFWVGFYVVQGQELVVGPFQGPIACTRIAFGRGVCGTAWKEKKTQLVPDVEAFPGHIACSSASKSEIVVPAFQDGKVFLVLDVDSDRLNDFDSVDQRYLEALMGMLEKTRIS
jgi:GAF domain-containing protein